MSTEQKSSLAQFLAKPLASGRAFEQAKAEERPQSTPFFDQVVAGASGTESFEEAFAAADQLIREKAPASVVLVNRKASWMTNPARKAQMTLLSRLYGKHKAWPDITQGQASHWINKRIGGK